MESKEKYINITNIISMFIFILFILSFFDFRTSVKGDSSIYQDYIETIADIELHKIRYGEYPKHLKDLKFTGRWTTFHFLSMEYRKVDNGYTLIPTDDFMTKVTFDLPDEFYQGLGLVNRVNSTKNMKVMNLGELKK